MQNMGRDEFELVDELEKLSQVAVPNAVKEIRDAKSFIQESVMQTNERDSERNIRNRGIVNECGQYEQCLVLSEFLQ